MVIIIHPSDIKTQYHSIIRLSGRIIRPDSNYRISGQIAGYLIYQKAVYPVYDLLRMNGTPTTNKRGMWPHWRTLLKFTGSAVLTAWNIYICPGNTGSLIKSRQTKVSTKLTSVNFTLSHLHHSWVQLCLGLQHSTSTGECQQAAAKRTKVLFYLIVNCH